MLQKDNGSISTKYLDSLASVWDLIGENRLLCPTIMEVVFDLMKLYSV